ncbi:hypothetical protein [Pseudonocardia sp. MH-G8]|uniref:hypothetical protein n=1 Tax=Pseudonocardia sp. MH-G8 TaxID=1854588 RepID=UPI00117BB614|nr:hypothetical protein [Pseudonocardia sp. MH-G8]
MPRRSRRPAPGPRWRTAPGLGADATADGPTVDDPTVDTDQAPPGRAWLTDAAPPPPRTLGRPSRLPVPNPADTGRFDDRFEVRREDRREADEDHGAAAGAAAETSEPPPPPSSAPPRTPDPAQPTPSDAEPEPEHQSAGEELPPPPQSAGRLERAAGGSNGARGVLARHTTDKEHFSRSIRSLEPISDLEAAAFAGRFAADFQSFDEEDPSHRAEVLRPLLADPQASTWGWSGVGRQRADSPLPGRIFRVSDTVVFVEVLVRTTIYVRIRPRLEPSVGSAPADVEPIGLVGPSSAPSESDPYWAATEANWVRMTVPVTRSADDGRLAVDPHLVPAQST